MLRGTDPSRLSPPHQTGGPQGHMRELRTDRYLINCFCCIQYSTLLESISVELGLQHTTGHSSLVTGHIRRPRLAVFIIVNPGPIIIGPSPKFLAAASTLCRSKLAGQTQPKGSTSQIILLILCHPCDMICEAPQWCGCVAAC